MICCGKKTFLTKGRDKKKGPRHWPRSLIQARCGVRPRRHHLRSPPRPVSWLPVILLRTFPKGHSLQWSFADSSRLQWRGRTGFSPVSLFAVAVSLWGVYGAHLAPGAILSQEGLEVQLVSVLSGGLRDPFGCLAALFGVEDRLADPDRQRSDLDELVLVDPFQGRLQGKGAWNVEDYGAVLRR